MLATLGFGERVLRVRRRVDVGDTGGDAAEIDGDVSDMAIDGVVLRALVVDSGCACC